MVKRIKKVTKGKVIRERKKVIVVGTEGNNKTEMLYLKELEKKQNRYHFIFAQGNETDPVKIVRNTAKRAEEEELTYKQGDHAVSIFDLDADEEKRIQLKAAKKEADKKHIELLTSNPSFEVWYLEHFGFTTKPFQNSEAVIRELKKRLPGYRKNHCDFEMLYPLTIFAIENCEKLDKYHGDNQAADEFANPRTDIYKLIKGIMPRGGEEK